MHPVAFAVLWSDSGCIDVIHLCVTTNTSGLNGVSNVPLIPDFLLQC